MTDEEGQAGRRGDGRNLVEEAKAAGARYAFDSESFAAIDPSAEGPILGLSESSHKQYEFDRANEPSLAEMVEASIRALEGDEDGFFLEVEAGRVDHANHGGNLHRVITDGVAFAEAVAKARELTDGSDTLIVVTADHEHAIAFSGYCGRGTPITGLCYGIDGAGIAHTGEAELADDGRPYTVVGYLNGPGSMIKKEAIPAALAMEVDHDTSAANDDQANEVAMAEGADTNAASDDPDYLQQAAISKSSETHSGEDVAVYASGPFAHLFDGTVEQNYLFHVMHHAALVAD